MLAVRAAGIGRVACRDMEAYGAFDRSRDPRGSSFPGDWIGAQLPARAVVNAVKVGAVFAEFHSESGWLMDLANTRTAQAPKARKAARMWQQAVRLVSGGAPQVR